jgi:hemolysin-activating ACP:hemolysin acyltransferase
MQSMISKKPINDKPIGVGGSEALNPAGFAHFLGLASWLMSMSNDHRDLPMSVLEQRVLPGILLKQFKLIEKGKAPVAFISWAKVSDEVKQRMLEPEAVLHVSEWRSGNNVIIIECVSPFTPADKLKSDLLSRLNQLGK